MKRFMKGCGILTLILIVVGVAMGLAGRSVADPDTIKEVVESATNGKVRMNAGSVWGWSIAWDNWNHNTFNIGFLTDDVGIIEERASCMPSMEAVSEFNEIYGFEVTDTSNINFAEIYEGTTFEFDDDYGVFRGDVPKYPIGASFHNLDVEIDNGIFTTVVSDDNKFYIEGVNNYKLQAFVEDDTLYVKKHTTTKGWDNEECEIILYLPENYYFQEVDMETATGYLLFENLNAGEVSLETSAGTIEINNLKAQELDASTDAGTIQLTGVDTGELDVEVGAGAVVVEGTVWGHVDVECAVGNVELSLTGRETDFNYYLENAMGRIIVGDNSYIGNKSAREKTIHNNALKDMDIECAMGSVTVWFEN